MQLQHDISKLLAQSLAAYAAFSGLRDLAEDLRILSLNAELAAARAQSEGRAIKALTQYTRELVRRLSHIDGELDSLKAHTYTGAADTIKWLNRLKMIERARAAEQGEVAAQAASRMTERVVERVGAITAIVATMAAATDRISEVAGQASAIATNVSVEAARISAGGGVFDAVARTMAGYAQQLQDMIAQAGSAVRDATQTSTRLRARHFSRAS